MADRDVAALSVKLNWYVNYVVDGGLVAAYPQLVGRPVTVQIFSSEAAERGRERDRNRPTPAPALRRITHGTRRP